MKMNEKFRPAGKKPRFHRSADHHEDSGRLFVRFELAAEKYAIPIDSVQEILKPQNLTEIPHTPDFLSGIVNLRGKIVPVVDLRLRLDLPQCEIKKSTRIIVIRGQEQFIGLLVDAVAEVCPIAKASIEVVSPIISGQVNSDYFEGIANIGDDIVALLDLKKVLLKPKKNIATQALTRQAT